jgi:hypothetical protein
MMDNRDAFLFGALSAFGRDLFCGIGICPNAETWEAWREVQLGDRLEAALGDPEIGPVALRLSQLVKSLNPAQANFRSIADRVLHRYAQLTVPLRGTPHELDCAIWQIEREFARAAWFAVHPRACSTCEGWAGSGDEDPYICPACAEQERCALCAGPITEDGFCMACNGEPGTRALPGAPAPFDGCGCGEIN